MYLLNNDSESINISQEWDIEFYQELMNYKSIYSTKETSEYYKEMLRVGVLPDLKNNFNWAMLCISYAINKGFSQNLDRIQNIPKTKGMEIPDFNTCFKNQPHLWLAILSEQLFTLYPDKKITKDDLYQYITQLWHVGASELWALWERCKEFKQGSDLEARKAFAQELVDLAHKNLQSAQPMNLDFTSVSELTNPPVFDDAEHDSKLKEAFDSLAIPVKSIDYLSKGLRYDCYQVQLTKYQDLIKKHDEICSALGKNETAVMIESADGVAFGYKIKILRPQHEWLERNQQDLDQALRQYQPNDFKLPICIGIDEQGRAIFKDLFDAPHLFITGATKSGKSACMRGLLQSLFTLNNNGTKIEVAILDKARVDYVCFENEQNLMPNQPIKDTDKMLEFLNECLVEMDHRLEQMESLGITNWADFRKTNPRPYRIIVIDELAGLVKVNKEVSKVLERLTAEARKTGFHLILSTQTANSENFSQTLRLNVPSRLAMKVDTADQSRTALDTAGAEKLLGKGDHLIKWVGEPIVFAHSYNI